MSEIKYGMPVLAARWPADGGVNQASHYQEKIKALEAELEQVKRSQAGNTRTLHQDAEIFKILRQVLLAKEGESLVGVAQKRMSELAQKPREGVPQEILHVTGSENLRCQSTLEEAIIEFCDSSLFLHLGRSLLARSSGAFVRQAKAFFQKKGYDLVEIVNTFGDEMLLVLQTKR